MRTRTLLVIGAIVLALAPVRASVRMNDPANAAGDALSRTAGAVGATTGTAQTFCIWVKRKVDTGTFATVWYGNNTTTSLETWLETETTVTTGDRLELFELPVAPAESEVAGPTLTVDTWFFVCGVRTNTSRNIYYGTEAGGTLTAGTANTDTRATASGTVDKIWIGQDPFTEGCDCELWEARWWETNLTPAEMQTEFCNATAQKAAIRGYWHLTSAATATTDSSGNTLTLTARGALTDGAGNPTVPSCSTGGCKRTLLGVGC